MFELSQPLLQKPRQKLLCRHFKYRENVKQLGKCKILRTENIDHAQAPAFPFFFS
jgi:hypothetical protein